MADNLNLQVISGKAFWARLAKPVSNYNKDGFEWKLDVSIDEATKKLLKAQGLGDKVKNKGDERGNFISFKRATVKKNGPEKGKDNKPITTVGPDGKTPWNMDTLLGNGTTVRVKFAINDSKGRDGKPSRRADIFAVQVLDLVPYEAPERSEFDAVEGAEATVAGKDW